MPEFLFGVSLIWIVSVSPVESVTSHLRGVGSELGKPMAYLTSSKFEPTPGGEALCPPPFEYALLQAIVSG